ncbi:MAG: hypothetical protein HY722_11205 [Planctomycetes bacterium]|nr:hypothetical protein [Planctomycetota bacterium]
MPHAGRPRPERRPRRDAASMLIVSLGILTLLSVLAVAFSMLMTVEKAASRNFVDGVRSRFLAEAGVSRSLTQLKDLVSVRPYTDPANDPWIYNELNYGVFLEQMAVDIDKAGGDPGLLVGERPSFFGELGKTYGAGGSDRYLGKVIDTNAQLNLNNRLDTETYRMVLDALGRALLETYDKNGAMTRAGIVSNPLAKEQSARDIQRYVESVEGARFASKSQVQDALTVFHRHRAPFVYYLLEDHVTVRSWMDGQAVLPGATDTLGRPPQWLRRERAPVNINAASEEVLTAVIAPLAGRFRYILAHDGAGGAPVQQAVDARSQFMDRAHQETTRYDAQAAFVYLPPIDYYEVKKIARLITLRRWNPKSGGTRVSSEETDLNGDRAPFRSFADWEHFIDHTQALRKSFPPPGSVLDMRGLQHPNITKLTGAARTDLERLVVEGYRSILKSAFNPNATPNYWNPDRTALRLVDKANLQYPADLGTGTTSGSHWDAVGQKGNMRVCQTVDWCFGPMGVFEVTSLGQVVGSPEAAQAITGTTTTPTSPGAQADERSIYGEAKLLTVVRLYEVVRHTAQKDFERNGHLYFPGGGTGARKGVRSYPENDIFWNRNLVREKRGTAEFGRNKGPLGEWFEGADGDEADPDVGWIQLDPSGLAREGRTYTGFVQSNAGDAAAREAVRLYQNTWDYYRGVAPRETVRPYADEIRGVDAFSEEANAINYEKLASLSTCVGDSYGAGVLHPDGFYVGAWRPTDRALRVYPWQRAAYDPEPDSDSTLDPNPAVLTVSQSNDGTPNVANPAPAPPPPGGPAPTAPPRPTAAPAPTPATTAAKRGNIGIYKGALEFWYKPEFDWSYRDEAGLALAPNPLVAGLFSASTVREQPRQPGLTAEPKGNLTRGTQMYIFRNASGDLRATRLYYELMDNGDFPMVKDPMGTEKIKVRDYLDRHNGKVAGSDPGNYPWPPADLDVDARCRYARTDVYLPYDHLKSWRSGEWHHVAVVWDDTVTPAPAPGDPEKDKEALRFYVDGVGLYSSLPRRIPGIDPANPTSAPFEPGMGIFVQVNELSSPEEKADADPGVWRDRMSFGFVGRAQQLQDGVFKFRQAVEEPAHGTVDDLHIFTGPNIDLERNPPLLERYPVTGTYQNHFELALPAGAQPAQLGALLYTVHLPTSLEAKDGVGLVTVNAWWQDAKTGRQASVGPFKLTRNAPPSLEDTQAGGCSLASTSGGFPELALGTPVHYSLTLAAVSAGLLDRSASVRLGEVASPVVDDLSLVWFLPKEEVLSKERVIFDPYSMGMPGLDQIASGDLGKWEDLLAMDAVAGRGGAGGAGGSGSGPGLGGNAGGGKDGGKDGGKTPGQGGPGDIDGDGIPDDRDPDMDGDGIPNEMDPDADGDGIPDDRDPDGGRGTSRPGDPDAEAPLPQPGELTPPREGWLEGLLVKYWDVGQPLEGYYDPQGRAPDRLGAASQLNFQPTTGPFADTPYLDHFAAHFEGKLYAHRKGSYTFYLHSSDGARLKLGNIWVVENPGVHGPREATGRIVLERGWHDLKLEFFEEVDEAALILEYQPPGHERMVVPPQVLWGPPRP